MRCSNTHKILALCIVVFFILILYFSSVDPNDSIQFPCQELAKVLGFPKSRVLVWGEHLVTKIKDGDICFYKDLSEKIAISKEEKGLSIWTFSSPPGSNYYLIEDGKKSHALHKMYFHEIQRVILPRNFSLFYELWKRSTLLPCLNLKMKRNETKRHNWDDSFGLKQMEKLLYHFVDHQMFLALAEGTLLGWYRECNIIPHTSDVDFAYRTEEHKNEPFDLIVANKTEFRPLYRYGKKGVDLEWTFFPSKTANYPHIDLFEVKFNGKSSYYTGFRGQTRIEFSYPIVYDPWCAADLKGYLFWIPCSVDTILRATYGEYRKEIPSSKFAYDRDQKNFKRVHTYTAEEWSSTFFKNYQR